MRVHCAGTAARLPARVDPMVWGMRRPVIGICTALEQARWSVWDQPALLLPRSYVEAVQRAGGLALMLPPTRAWSRIPARRSS